MSSLAKFWTDKVLPFVPGVVRRDFWRKLFSFVFALLLTLFVHKSVKEDTEYHTITLHDVEVRAVPETEGAGGGEFMLVPWEMNPTVSVKLSVPVDTKDVKNKDMYLECTVTKDQIDNNRSFELGPDNLKLRRSIDFKEVVIHPSALPLNLDYYVEKDVPVEPVYDPNEVVSGYRLDGKPTVEVNSVRIRGPKKVLAGISVLTTEKIPLRNVTNDFSCPVRPVLPYEVKSADVRILSDTVRVDVRIKQNKSQVIESIPLHVITGKGDTANLVIAEIMPETVNISIEDVQWRNPRQDAKKTGDISRDQIHAVLDLSGMRTPGVYSVPVKYWSDNDGFKVVRADPAKASVRLIPVPSSN